MKRVQLAALVIVSLGAFVASCSSGADAGSRTTPGGPGPAAAGVMGTGEPSSSSTAGTSAAGTSPTTTSGGRGAAGISASTGGSSNTAGSAGSVSSTTAGGGASAVSGGSAGTGGQSSAASGMDSGSMAGAMADSGGTGSSGSPGDAAAGTMAAGGSSAGGTGSVSDPDAVQTVNGWFDDEDVIPSWAIQNMGGGRDQIIDALIKSCEMFGPPPESNPGWEQRYCWAHLTSSMLKESSYQPTLNDTENSPGRDSYSVRTLSSGATAYDPTLGLLQVRFSSTVKDYTQYGPREAMTYIGCNFPELGHENEGGDSDFWALTGPTDNMALMLDIPCNVALGTWYYYMYATGNGVQNQPIYAYDYCQLGRGTAATLTVGLLSHLNGPAGAYQTDTGSNDYVNNIRTTFTACMGGSLPNPDPFTVALQPNPSQYCR